MNQNLLKPIKDERNKKTMVKIQKTDLKYNVKLQSGDVEN